VQAAGGGSPELTGDDEPVRIPIEDALDLHAFAPRDVPSVVSEYLVAAAQSGFVEVRLIHGRGIGVQRAIVRSLLSKHPLVVGFADAPPERGGPGATIVQLARGTRR
jgi:DNA-nicking Smr family endonuclease